MASTQDILDAAKKLGELIARHETAQRFEAAVRKLQEDVQAQRAMNDFNRFLQTLAQKEAQGQPIEVEDKRKLESLQTAVIRNPLLREMQASQMDYVDLIRKVDEAMLGSAPELPGQGAVAAEAPLVNPDLAR